MVCGVGAASPSGTQSPYSEFHFIPFRVRPDGRWYSPPEFRWVWAGGTTHPSGIVRANRPLPRYRVALSSPSSAFFSSAHPTLVVLAAVPGILFSADEVVELALPVLVLGFFAAGF